MLQEQFNDFMNQNFDKAISSEVALAVSGGSDSIALLFLASKWAKQNQIKLVVFSVDHRLRKESSDELEFVRRVSLTLEHKFVEFIWQHDNSKSALQERARLARYEMMTNKCHELGINSLLTAHHYDDFLENYLMRKRKKSGILGLSNSYSTFYDNIQILRPLFNIKKNDLVDYLNANSITWMEDKSNNLDFYERNRVRHHILSMPKEDKISLEEEANIADIKATEFNNKFIEEIAKNIEFNKLGFAFIDLDSYRKLDYEIAVYIINFVLTSISGKIDTPRYRSTKKLIDKVSAGDNFDSSLHECILREVNDKILIFREKNAINSNSVNLKNGVIWDNRFRFNIDNEFVDEELKICLLDMEDYIDIKDKLDFQNLSKSSMNNHKDILFTLPVIKNLEKVVAIPHISYYDGFKSNSGVDVIFSPGFVSRFTHFL